MNKDSVYGDLTLVSQAKGIVLFAHGSGSSRLSQRNRSVAQRLHQEGLSTLLFDLLTHREEEVDRLTGEYRFDIPLLASRLKFASDWVRQTPELASLPMGYFGASTGAAAALMAAEGKPDNVRAVVSRGGRPDLAGDLLVGVKAPTLLIVGGNDTSVLELNEQACQKLRAVKQLTVIPGATHLFEEPGALEQVGDLAARWFDKYLAAEPRSR